MINCYCIFYTTHPVMLWDHCMPKHALSYAMIYEIVSKLCGKLIKCLRLCCDLWLSKKKKKKKPTAFHFYIRCGFGNQQIKEPWQKGIMRRWAIRTYMDRRNCNAKYGVCSSTLPKLFLKVAAWRPVWWL